MGEGTGVSTASQSRTAWRATLVAGPGTGAGLPYRPQLLTLSLACFLLLLLPALINGAPIFYPDSWGYLAAGVSALDKAAALLGLTAADSGHSAADAAAALETRAANGISSIRSPYYGVLLVICQRLAGPWAIVVLQSAITALSLALVLQRLVTSRAMLAAALLALLLTGGGFFTGALLPDGFTGPALLALAMIASGVAMAGRERAWWLAVLLASLLFHKAHVALLAAVLPLALFPLLRRALVRWPDLLALLVVSVAAHLAVTITVERLTGQKMLDPPVLLARVIADGPGKRHLAAHCPAADYAICAWVDHLPDDANQMLWSRDPDNGFFALLSLPEKRRIAAEANGIVLASIAEYPGEQLLSSLGQFGRQLVTVGVTELDVDPGLAHRETGIAGNAGIPAWRETAIGQDAMPLQLVSRVMLLVYLLALVPALLLLSLALRPLASNASGRLAIWLLAGLVANAAVNGVLAGVFDRYQGRVAFVAVVALLALLTARRQVLPEPAVTAAR